MDSQFQNLDRNQRQSEVNFYQKFRVEYRGRYSRRFPKFAASPRPLYRHVRCGSAFGRGTCVFWTLWTGNMTYVRSWHAEQLGMYQRWSLSGSGSDSDRIFTYFNATGSDPDFIIALWLDLFRILVTLWLDSIRIHFCLLHSKSTCDNELHNQHY